MTISDFLTTGADRLRSAVCSHGWSHSARHRGNVGGKPGISARIAAAAIFALAATAILPANNAMAQQTGPGWANSSFTFSATADPTTPPVDADVPKGSTVSFDAVLAYTQGTAPKFVGANVVISSDDGFNMTPVDPLTGVSVAANNVRTIETDEFTISINNARTDSRIFLVTDRSNDAGRPGNFRIVFPSILYKSGGGETAQVDITPRTNAGTGAATFTAGDAFRLDDVFTSAGVPGPRDDGPPEDRNRFRVRANVNPSAVTYTVVETTATLARTSSNTIPAATGESRTFTVEIDNVPATVTAENDVRRVRLTLDILGTGIDSNTITVNDGSTNGVTPGNICAGDGTECGWLVDRRYTIYQDVLDTPSISFIGEDENRILLDVLVPAGGFPNNATRTVTFTLNTITTTPIANETLIPTLTGFALHTEDGTTELRDVSLAGIPSADLSTTFTFRDANTNTDTTLDRSLSTIGGRPITIDDESDSTNSTGTVSIPGSLTADSRFAEVSVDTLNDDATVTSISFARTIAPTNIVAPMEDASSGAFTQRLTGLVPGTYIVTINTEAADEATERKYNITLTVEGVSIARAGTANLPEAGAAGEFTVSLAGIDTTDSVTGVAITLDVATDPVGTDLGDFAEDANVADGRTWQNDLFVLEFPDTVVTATNISNPGGTADRITFIATLGAGGTVEVPIGIAARREDPSLRGDYIVSIVSVARVVGNSLTPVGDPLTARPDATAAFTVEAGTGPALELTITDGDDTAREADTSDTAQFMIRLRNLGVIAGDVLIPYTLNTGSSGAATFSSDYTVLLSDGASFTSSGDNFAPLDTGDSIRVVARIFDSTGNATITMTITAVDDRVREAAGRETIILGLTAPTDLDGDLLSDVFLEVAEGLQITIADGGLGALDGSTHDFTDVCDRTDTVQTAIRTAIDSTNPPACETITAAQIAAITGVAVGTPPKNTLDIGASGNLKLGDLDDLTSVEVIDVRNDSMTDFPPDLFRDLSTLERVLAQTNNFGELDAATFNGLDGIRRLAFSSVSFADNALNDILGLRGAGVVPFERLTIPGSLKRYANFNDARATLTADSSTTIQINLGTTAIGGDFGTLPTAVFIPVTVTGPAGVSVPEVNVMSGDTAIPTSTTLRGVVIPVGADRFNLPISTTAGAVEGNRTISIGTPLVGVLSSGVFTRAPHSDGPGGTGDQNNIVHRHLAAAGTGQGSQTTATVGVGPLTATTLNDLSFTPAPDSLTPAFETDVTDAPYDATATFAALTTGFTVNATATDTNADIVSIAAIRVVPSGDPAAPPVGGTFLSDGTAQTGTATLTGLTPGGYTVTITVRPERGDDVEYVITATIPGSTTAALATLAVTNTAGGGAITLNPDISTFDPTTSAYTASVANSVESVTVTPTADASGTYAVTATGPDGSSARASGSDGVNAATEIDLSVGDTTVSIAVTSQSGVLRPTPYTIVFTRARALARLSLTPTAPVASPEEFATNLAVPGEVAIEVEHGTTDATLSITASDTDASTTISTPVATLPLTVSDFLTSTNIASATFANIDGNSNVFTFTIDSAGTVATEYTVTITWGSAGGAGGYTVSLGGNASVPADTTAATSVNIRLSEIPYSVTNSRGNDADLTDVDIPLKVQFDPENGDGSLQNARLVVFENNDSSITSGNAEIVINSRGTGANFQVSDTTFALGEFFLRVPVSALTTRPRRGDATASGGGDITLSINTQSPLTAALPQAVTIASNGRLRYVIAERDGDADPVGAEVSAASEAVFTIRGSVNTLSALTAGSTDAGGFSSPGGNAPGTYGEVALDASTASVAIVANPTVDDAHVLICDFNNATATPTADTTVAGTRTTTFGISDAATLNVAVYVTPASNPNPHTVCATASEDTDAGNLANRAGRGVYRFPVRVRNPRVELTRVSEGAEISNTANATARAFAVTLHDVANSFVAVTIPYSVEADNPANAAGGNAECGTANDYVIGIDPFPGVTGVTLTDAVCNDLSVSGTINLAANAANVYLPTDPPAPIYITITPQGDVAGGEGRAADGEVVVLSLGTVNGITVDVDSTAESVTLDGTRPPTVMIDEDSTAVSVTEGETGVVAVRVNRGIGGPSATGDSAVVRFTLGGAAATFGECNVLIVAGACSNIPDGTDYLVTASDGVNVTGATVAPPADGVHTLTMPFTAEEGVANIQIIAVEDSVVDPNETVIITLTELSFPDGEAPIGVFGANDIRAMGGSRSVIAINDHGATLTRVGSGPIRETESAVFNFDVSGTITNNDTTHVRARLNLKGLSVRNEERNEEFDRSIGALTQNALNPGLFENDRYSIEVSSPSGSLIRIFSSSNIYIAFPVSGEGTAFAERFVYTVTPKNLPGNPEGVTLTFAAEEIRREVQGSERVPLGNDNIPCAPANSCAITFSDSDVLPVLEAVWQSQSGAALTTEAGLNARIAERSETSVTRVLSLPDDASPDDETVDVTFTLGGTAAFGNDDPTDDDYTLDIIDARGDPVRSAGGGVFAPAATGGTFRLPASAANNSVSFVVVARTDASTETGDGETVVIRVTGIRTSGGAEVAVPEVDGFTATIADYGTFPTARLEAINGKEAGVDGEFVLTLENFPNLFDVDFSFSVDVAPDADTSYVIPDDFGLDGLNGTFPTAIGEVATLTIPASRISPDGSAVARIRLDVGNQTIDADLDITLTTTALTSGDASILTNIATTAIVGADNSVNNGIVIVTMLEQGTGTVELSRNGFANLENDGNFNRQYTISFDGIGGDDTAAITIPYTFTGTATGSADATLGAGEDYILTDDDTNVTITYTNATSGTIAVTGSETNGRRTIDLRITPAATAANGETIIMTLGDATGTPAATALNPAIADRTTTIVDRAAADVMPARVEITASDGVEGGDSGSFRLDLFNIPDDEPINVRAAVLDDGDPAVSHYVIRTATDDGDFNSDPITPSDAGAIEFTAANNDAITIEINPVNDTDTVSEVVTLVIEKISFGDDSETRDDISGANVNLPAPASLRIQDDDVAAATAAALSVENGAVAEGQNAEGQNDDPASFLLTLNLPNEARNTGSAGVEIDFTVSGTATAPMDLIEVDAVADLTDYILYAEYTGANDVLVRVGPDISEVINAGDLGNIEGVSAAFDRNFVAATTAGVASGKLTIPLADLSAVEEVRFFVAPQNDGVANEDAETVILQINRISADGPTNGTPVVVAGATASGTVRIIDAPSFNSGADPVAWVVPTGNSALVEGSGNRDIDAVHVATVFVRNLPPGSFTKNRPDPAVPGTLRGVTGNIVFRDSSGVAASTRGINTNAINFSSDDPPPLPELSGGPTSVLRGAGMEAHSTSLNVITSSTGDGGPDSYTGALDFGWTSFRGGGVLADDFQVNALNGGQFCANQDAIGTDGAASIDIYMRPGNDALPQGPKTIHAELTNMQIREGAACRSINAGDSTAIPVADGADGFVVTLVDDGDSTDPAVSVEARASTLDESPSSTPTSGISGYDLVIGNEGGPDEPDDVPDGAGITEVIFTLTEETTNPTATFGAARMFNRGGVMTSYSPLASARVQIAPNTPQNPNPGVPDFTIAGDGGKTIYYSAAHDEYAIFFAENERNAANDTLRAGFTITAVEDDYDESLGSEGLSMTVKSVRYVGLDMAFSIDPAAGRSDSITSRDSNNDNNDDGNGSVNFTGGNGTVDEEGETAITRNLDITGVDPNQFVDVRFTLAGTATLNEDYGLVIRDGDDIRVLNTAGSPFEPTATGGTFRLPAGAANQASFTITAYADDDNTAGETVMITVDAINSPSGGGDTGFTGTATLTATIDNDDGTPPSASLISGDAIEAGAFDDATDGYFELTLENAPNLDAIVEYSIVNTGGNPDVAFYEARLVTDDFPRGSTLILPAPGTSGTLVIPASAADEISARILIHAFVDGPDITDKSVALTIKSIMFMGTVGEVNRIQGVETGETNDIDGNPATVAIIEGNEPTATLMRMSPESLPESDTNGAMFMIAFSNLPNNDQQVLGCMLTSDAVYGGRDGDDYTLRGDGDDGGTGHTTVTGRPVNGAAGGACEITVASEAFSENPPRSGVFTGMGEVRIVPRSDDDTSEEPEPILLRLVGSTDLAVKNPPIARSRVNIVEEVRSSARLSPSSPPIPAVSIDEGGSTDITVTVHPGGGDLASSGWADVAFTVSGSGRTVTVVPDTGVSRITASGFRLDDGDGDVIIRVASAPNSISANQDITVTLTGLAYQSHLGLAADAGRLNAAGLETAGNYMSVITVVNNGDSTLNAADDGLTVTVGGGATPGNGTVTNVTDHDSAAALSSTGLDVWVATGDTSVTFAATATDGTAGVLICDDGATISGIPLAPAMAKKVEVFVTAANRVDGVFSACGDARTDSANGTTTAYTYNVAQVPAPAGMTILGNAPVNGAENVPDARDGGGTEGMVMVPLVLSGFPEQVRVGTALLELTHVDVPIDTGGLIATPTATLLASGAIEYVNTSATTMGYEGDYTITPIDATVQSASDSGFVLRVPVDDGGARPNLLITTLVSEGDNDDMSVTFTPQTAGYRYIVDDGNDTPGDDSPPVGTSDFDNPATNDVAFIIRAAGDPYAMITTVTSGNTVAEGAVGKEFLITLTGVDSSQMVILHYIIDASAADSATWHTDDTMGDYTMEGVGNTIVSTPGLASATNTVSGTITIPAGNTTGGFRIVARDDSGDVNPVDPGETIALAFDTREASGITPRNLRIGSPSIFNLVIVEDATAEISAPTSIDEGTTGNVTVMIDRGPILSTEPATVTFTVTPGDENTTTRDYAITDNTDNGRDVSTGGTFTIPMGETEGVLTFRARDDDVIDPRETVTITVTSVQFTGLTGENAALDDHLALGVFTPDSAMVTINNTDAGASISAPTPATIREVASTAPDPVLMTASTFRVTIASPPSAGRATTITLALGSGPLYGNADPNDYVIATPTAGVMLTEPNAGANGGTLTALIEAGRITAGTDFPVDFTVTATNDMQSGESAETIRITLAGIDDATNDFDLESPTTHTITLVDDDVVVRASLSGDISIGEKAQGEGVITLNLGGYINSLGATTVTFSISNPAGDPDATPDPIPTLISGPDNPADYTLMVGPVSQTPAFAATTTNYTVAVPEGTSTATFTFTAIDDDRREGNEVVGLTITGLMFSMRSDLNDSSTVSGATANVTITEVSGEDVMRETQMITHVVGKEQVNLVTGLVRQRVSALTLGSPQGFSEPGVQLALAENPETIQDFFSQMALESSGEMDDGGAFAIWAKGQYIKISGSPDVAGQDNFEYDGKIAGIGMGMEKRFKESLVGLSMNFSTADIDSKSDMRAEGNYKETMTFFAPYAAWKPDNSRLTLWGTAGAGFGSAEITGGEDHGEGNPSVQAFFAQGGVDISDNIGKTAEVVFGMSAVAIEKTVDAWTAGALSVPEASSSVFQAQADFTAYFPVYSDDGQVLRPYVGLASVHDVGDVTNDDRHAMELQTGIAWSNGPWQVSFDTFYQFLRDDEEAWGVFGEAQWSGRGDLDGLLMGVTSGHGTASSMSDAASSTDSVNSDINTNLADADTETAEWSIQTTTEYGFAAPVMDRNGRATPFFRSTHSADARSFVSGMRLDVTDNVGVTAESSRHIPADDDPYSEHAVGLEARWGF